MTMESKRRYLFVCNYAQSRSKWFAEKFMKLGKMAMFCGIHEQADFRLCKEYEIWADVIIVLEEHIVNVWYHNDAINFYMNIHGKARVDFYIEDEPNQFNSHFKVLKKLLIQKQLW